MAEMTPERIADIRQREQQASEGPWYIEPHDRPGFRHERRIYDRHCWGVCKPTSGKEGQDEANAQFIAHARQDIPDLLAALDRAQQEIADLREVLEQIRVAGHAASHPYGKGFAEKAEKALAPRTPGETGGTT